jgi:hypothetical protein
MTGSPSHRDLDAEAEEALEAAQSMPHGSEKTEALKKAGLLRRAAGARGIAFAKRGNAFANTVPTRAKNVMLQISAKLLEVLGAPGWIRISDHSIDRYRAGVVGRSLV